VALLPPYVCGFMLKTIQSSEHAVLSDEKDADVSFCALCSSESGRSVAGCACGGAFFAMMDSAATLCVIVARRKRQTNATVAEERNASVEPVDPR